MPTYQLPLRNNRPPTEPRGCRNIYTVLNRKLPQAGLRFLGVCAARPVKGTDDASTHNECRGLDLGFLSRDCDPWGFIIMDFLIDNADQLGVQEVVFCKWFWGFGGKFYRRQREDTPGGDHKDHLHMGLTREAADNLTEAMIERVFDAWWAGRQKVITDVGEDDDMKLAIVLWKDQTHSFSVVGDKQVTHRWHENASNPADKPSEQNLGGQAADVWGKPDQRGDSQLVFFTRNVDGSVTKKWNDGSGWNERQA